MKKSILATLLVLYASLCARSISRPGIHKPKTHTLKQAPTAKHAAREVIAPDFYTSVKPTGELRFVFIVPSYNNAQWYKKNLTSMLSQNYQNFHVIYVDDASPDGTGKLVEDFIKEHRAEDRVTLIKNQSRQGIMANRHLAINLCEDRDICIALDGDDWLPHNNVLPLYNSIYHNEQIWVTYGRYLEYPSMKEGSFAKKVPQNILQQNAIRSYAWCCSHLKTFRAWLFKKIRREDLCVDGAFIPMATDLAMMLPMVEMAQHHSFFVPEVTCIYNTGNPLAVIKQKKGLHLHYNRCVRAKKPYAPLDLSRDRTAGACAQKHSR